MPKGMAKSFLPEQQFQDYQRKLCTQLRGGINAEAKPNDLQDNEMFDELNVAYFQGTLRVDNGYTTFGAVLNGVPQGAFQFFLTNGSNFLLLATTLSFYLWNTTVLQWQLVGDSSATTTLSAQTNAGSNSFTFTSVAGFAVNNLIAIVLNDGSQLQTTISTIVGSVVTTVAAVPAGKTALNGASAIKAAVLAGSLDKPIDFQTIPQNSFCAFTNQVDNVKYFDGTFLRDFPGIFSGLGFNVQCQNLNLFHGSLLLLNTVENGVAKPQRIRRSSNTDVTNWTTNNAGFDDLQDTEDFIQTSAPLGPYLIIYRETTIMRASYYGQPTLFYFYEYTIEGEGALSNTSVDQIGASHVFVGNSGIYEYFGDYSLVSIGDKIFWRTLAITGNLNPNFKQRVFAFYVEELDEFWVFYPSGSNSLCDTLLRCDLEVNAFHIRKFFNKMIGFGFFLKSTSRIWSSLVGSWLAQTWQWGSRETQANAPLTLLCAGDTSQVMSYDYISPNDNGNVISFSFTSKEHGDPQQILRLNRLKLFGTGNGVLVEASLDEGKSFFQIGTANFGPNPTLQSLYYQVSFNYIMFRVSGSDPLFTLRWYELEFLPESVW